ncbi:MAG: EAL domain-containing response regulator [Oscillatoriales cyanobacterium RM2_1_1]|nr:EAL domain-containing response regulator [Oscillatoriales cyanobacterium SM2_3_0]NJO46405.1 EAL domain-containing response regulator [Oscillatoriales cyanobacterium RM2_1_1]
MKTTTIPSATTQVMIVEDELIVAENVARNLKKFGYDVSAIVDSGEEAIQTARNLRPDMILMDIMLQGDMDGIEAAGQIHNQFKIPVVYMTAYGDEVTLERTKKTEPYGYLLKPFKPQDMRATIETALTRYRVEQSALERLTSQMQLLSAQTQPYRSAGLNSPVSKSGILKSVDIHAANAPGLAAIETKLRQAIAHQQFHLNYQPQLNLQTGEITGAEALLRWYHPEEGMIPPNVFISLAESTGLIYELDEWVLKTVCQRTLLLHRLGFESMTIAANLSGHQFSCPDMNQRLIQIAQEAQLDLRFVKLELTESVLVNDIDIAIQNCTELSNLGVHISIDDFGTGYSSLGYLQNLPFNTLKIDQAFVRDVDKNLKHQAIVQAIINMAHQLGLEVIAEGVETAAELKFLRQHQCDVAQGYLISRPIPWIEFQMFLTEYRDGGFFNHPKQGA